MKVKMVEIMMSMGSEMDKGLLQQEIGQRFGIHEGYIMQSSTQTEEIGGKRTTEHLHELLNDGWILMEISNDVEEELGFVRLTADDTRMRKYNMNYQMESN